MLPLGLASACRSSVRHLTNKNDSRPRAACMRFSACGHTRVCGPSRTLVATSSPRWAGRQCRKIGRRARRCHQASSTVKPAKAVAPAAASASWPIDVQTSV